MKKLSLLSLSVLAAGCATSSGAAPQTPNRVGTTTAAEKPIDRAMVESAERAWCDALVSISNASARNQDPRTLAQQALSTAYGYEWRPGISKRHRLRAEGLADV
ncbi:MAG: hypothetical protein NT062_20310 [Proteobacteria bacterium]|nr:hypothetical protein [Pseudomonadota bacterium]